MTDRPSTFHIGQAGVYRVAAELLLRGVSVYFPALDRVGVDLVTEHGIRLQVKSARLRVRAKLSTRPAYYLHLGWAQQGAEHKPVRRARLYSEEVNYFVIWGIDEDRFWIVPAHVFDGRYCLMLYAGQREPVFKRPTTAFPQFAAHVYAHENRWDLLLPKAETIMPTLKVVGQE